jgi:hypothetical protein
MPQQFSTNLNLSVLPEIEQKKSPDVYAELLRIRNALRTLQAALDLYTGALEYDSDYWSEVYPTTTVRLQNISRLYVIASEPIAVGQAVNFWNNAGVLTARLADAATPRYARAICSTVAGIPTGEFGEVMLFGAMDFFTGLAPGSYYYLSDTPGFVSNVPGTNSQLLGTALSGGILFFDVDFAGSGGGGGGASWGSITGTLSSQADLVAALAAKSSIDDVIAIEVAL